MTQSTNARPCNCDQALKAEERFRELETDLRVSQEDEREWYSMYRESEGREAANNTRLATITRILCDLVSAPSLDVAQFADPTLERIRLAMLGRER